MKTVNFNLRSIILCVACFLIASQTLLGQDCASDKDYKIYKFIIQQVITEIDTIRPGKSIDSLVYKKGRIIIIDDSTIEYSVFNASFSSSKYIDSILTLESYESFCKLNNKSCRL